MILFLIILAKLWIITKNCQIFETYGIFYLDFISYQQMMMIVMYPPPNPPPNPPQDLLRNLLHLLSLLPGQVSIRDAYIDFSILPSTVITIYSLSWFYLIVHVPGSCQAVVFCGRIYTVNLPIDAICPLWALNFIGVSWDSVRGCQSPSVEYLCQFCHYEKKLSGSWNVNIHICCIIQYNNIFYRLLWWVIMS